MYTLNFRFRKKFHRLLNSRNNAAFIRLLIFVMLFTFIFTSYLYGLIEISSKKLVIKISGANDLTPDKNSNIYDDSAVYENNKDDDQRRKIIVNLKPNKRLRADEESDLRKTNSFNSPINNIVHSKSDYLTKLFLRIERSHSMIKSELTKDEIGLVEKLKEKYEKALSEKKSKSKSETKLNKNVNDDEEDEDEDEDKLFDGFSSSELVTRDLLVKCIQYEKILLRKKLKNDDFKTIKELLVEYSEKNKIDMNELAAVWKIYFNDITELQLNNNTIAVNTMLNSMATSPVVTASEKEKGTQIKLVLLLEDGTDVLVKPMKTPRDYETPPDHFYFVDFERHHAEIAAYHVDKVLGFNRVPPTIGRLFDVTKDLWEKAEPDLEKTFFHSPANNTCFTGHCSYYCDTTHAICGKPKDKLEGSVQLFLPAKPLVEWKVSTHPYRRTYNKRKKAEWELNDNYCVEKLFQDGAYQSKLLLDIIDMSLFDFFTGNMDRHHFERMISLGKETFSLHLDNGRSFGKPFHDEMSILAPFKQCCLIRYSTYLRLKYLYKNNFALLLDESLKNDPLYPILTPNYLNAVNRRLVIVFNELSRCIDNFKPNEVLVDDGY